MLITDLRISLADTAEHIRFGVGFPFGVLHRICYARLQNNSFTNRGIGFFACFMGLKAGERMNMEMEKPGSKRE